jgi:uncharacterized protein YhfF
MTTGAIEMLPATAFGSGPETEVRLAALILAGRKRATVWNGLAANETTPGMIWRVTAKGRNVATIRTLSVEQRRFCDIDAEFAFEEGEGDRSLEFWRIVHEQYFRDEGFFAPDMLLWCERFRLVDVIDQELAEAAQRHVELEGAEAAAILKAAGKG